MQVHVLRHECVSGPGEAQFCYMTGLFSVPRSMCIGHMHGAAVLHMYNGTANLSLHLLSPGFSHVDGWALVQLHWQVLAVLWTR